MRLIEDEIIQVANGNTEMDDAIDQARGSIGKFFEAFENPQPNQTSFLIKACFAGEESSEHIWLADLDFNARPATGVVANEPGISTLRYMERVSFLPEQVSDWMYLEDGRLIGGFTTKVLMRAKGLQDGFRSLSKASLVM